MNHKEIITEELLKTIGKNLSTIRLDKGEDVNVVANAVGIRPGDLEEIEAGTFKLTIELLVEIANYYKIGLQQIMELAVAKIFNFTQTNSNGSGHKQYVVNDHTNGYDLLVGQLQEEVKYLRGYFEKYIELTEGSKKSAAK